MLCFESFDRRWRRRLRRRYWVLARSVWRIERRRFRLGLCVVCFVEGSMSAEEAARSSIVSILYWLVCFVFVELKVSMAVLLKGAVCICPCE